MLIRNDNCLIITMIQRCPKNGHHFNMTTEIIQQYSNLPAEVFFTVQTALGLPGNSETAISDT